MYEQIGEQKPPVILDEKDVMPMIEGLITQVRLTWRLLKDPRVPIFLKALPLLGVLYVLFPIDIVPDFLPILGQLDDLGVVLAGLKVFEKLVPQHIVREHLDAIQFGTVTVSPNDPNNVIDGSKLRRDEKAKRSFCYHVLLKSQPLLLNLVHRGNGILQARHFVRDFAAETLRAGAVHFFRP